MRSRILGAIGFWVLLGISSAVVADTLTYDTGQSEFSPGSRNQGWWSNSSKFPGKTTIDNYFTGYFKGGFELRSFFTFDLSSLSQNVTSATLVIHGGAYNSPDATETLGFFDVSTAASAVNNNTGFNVAIWSDLGSGTSYGSFELGHNVFNQSLSFKLNAQALGNINASEGGFFTVGGTLLTPSIGAQTTQAVFASSGGTSQQLILETGPVAQPAPLPGAAFGGIALFSLIGARKYLGRRTEHALTAIQFEAASRCAARTRWRRFVP